MGIITIAFHFLLVSFSLSKKSEQIYKANSPILKNRYEQIHVYWSWFIDDKTFHPSIDTMMQFV